MDTYFTYCRMSQSEDQPIQLHLIEKLGCRVASTSLAFALPLVRLLQLLKEEQTCFANV